MGHPLSSYIRMLACVACTFAGALLAAGPKAYVGNFKDNTVSVVDTASKTVTATIPVVTGPHGMLLTPDGRWLFVCGDGSSSMSVIDTATDQVTRTIDVGKSPHGLALTPDGKTLLVVVNGENRIDFIDTATLSNTGTLAVVKPHTVSVRADGAMAYVTSQDPGHFSLTVIDLGTRTVARSIPLDKMPRDLEFGADGRLYFTEAGVSAVEVLDPKTDKIVAEIPTGVSPHYVNFFSGAPAGIAVVQGPGELMLFDPATNKPLRSFPVGKQPHWAAVSGDGKTAYVTNEGSNDLSIVELATGKASTLPVGQAPRKVVVQASSDSM